MEIARLLGWYRIPLRTAPKVVFVDYLAFYQPASFGDHGGEIEYIAEVRGHELTTRAELLRDEPDHPHAREEYYKIQIGALEKLPAPISAEQVEAADLPLHHRGISAQRADAQRLGSPGRRARAALALAAGKGGCKPTITRILCLRPISTRFYWRHFWASAKTLDLTTRCRPAKQ